MVQPENVIHSETKTDIDIVQELLAMYSSRKEIIEKLEPTVKENSFLSLLRKHKLQTEQFINQLMEELSLHGDAVLSDVDRTSAYFEAVKKMPVQGSEEEDELRREYDAAESKLKDYYTAVLSSSSQEPTSLEEILQQQVKLLQEL